MMPEMHVNRIGDTSRHDRLETLAEGEASCEVLVIRAPGRHRMLVLRHEASGELCGTDVEFFDLLWRAEFFWLLRHKRRPLMIEIDEVLRRDLALFGIGLEQRLRAQPRKHIAELPGEVPPVLHRDVHALTGLRAVRVAGVTHQEDAALAIGRRGLVVEAVGEAMRHLVHAVPGYVTNVEAVGMHDRVRLRNNLLKARLTHLAVIVLVDLSEINVDAA